MQNKMLIILSVVLLVNCGNGGNRTKIIPKDKFVDILVDIHLFDAFTTDYSLKPYIENIDSLTIYSSIMAKHNTNGNSFKATMEWYSAHPKKLSEVYNDVFGKLTKLEQENTDTLNMFNSPTAKPIYHLGRYDQVIGDTASYPKPIIVPARGKGTYLFEVQMRMLTDDKSINPKIVAYFMKSDKDDNEADRLTVIDKSVQKSSFSRNYQYTYVLNDPSYKFITLIIPKTDNTDTVFMKNMQLTSVKILRIPPALKEDKKEEK